MKLCVLLFWGAEIYMGIRALDIFSYFNFFLEWGQQIKIPS